MRINQKIRLAIDPWGKTPCRATDGKPLGRGWKYVIVRRHTYYGNQEDTYNIVDDDQWDPIVLDLYEDAADVVESLDGEVYYLMHNESERPEYFVVGIPMEAIIRR